MAPGWGRPAPLAEARSSHTATLLSSGKVLVVGGDGPLGMPSTVEVFDPATGVWTAAAPLLMSRWGYTATLLPSGKVLVVGGVTDHDILLSAAELYDPGTDTWSSTGSLSVGRMNHTATLLPSGRVLVVGGFTQGGWLASAEVYDPATGTWSPTGALAEARERATAVLLPSGKVLVAGGSTGLESVGSAEVYDPATGTWSATGPLSQARRGHTMTLLPTGRVLVAGGYTPDSRVTTAELYDPAAGTWAATGSLNQDRYAHTAALLPSGKLLVAGGVGPDRTPLTSAELYDPVTGTWALTAPLTQARGSHTATLLPTGRVLVVGGHSGSGPLDSAELYEPGAGSWTRTQDLPGGRSFHGATLLPTGRVLVVAGGGANTHRGDSQLHDPATGTWTATGALLQARQRHTVTLLPSGRVLAAGGTGNGGSLASAELYDPAAGLWSETGALAQARDFHTATLLPSGRVLVVGGSADNSWLSSAELYDPASGTWSATGSLAMARRGHTATLLPSGRVLVVGGMSDNGRLSSAELYDPATGTWTATGSLSQARAAHTATLLPSGQVLVAGGDGGSDPLASAEVYDPRTGAWSATGSLSQGRYAHTATLLPTGRVLVAGGSDGTGPSPVLAGELYDPATGTWADTARPASVHYYHTATLLPSGRVLMVGGLPFVSMAEVYDDTGGDLAWRPVVGGLSPGSTLPAGRDFTVNGSRMRGVSEGSGGSSQASSTDYPLLTLLSLEGGRLATLPAHDFSSTHASAVVPTLPYGPYLLFVTVNGLSSSTLLHIDGRLTPLETQLTAVPVSPTRQAYAYFGFTSNDAGSRFECRLDGAAFFPCESLYLTGRLAEGTHTFEVRAWDGAGNVDETPASHTWRIDRTPPETHLASVPPVLTTETAATFTFSSDEAGTTFECSQWGGPFYPCGSPVVWQGLYDGTYSFLVRAVDEAGNRDSTPATHTWRVDLLTPASQLLGTPASPSNHHSATFSFTSDEEGASFECRLDEEAFAPCESPVVTGSLADGSHTFQVRARDAVGHVEAPPSTHVWRVDLTPPRARIDSAPASPTLERAATFAFSSDEEGVQFQCSLDGASFILCTSPLTFTYLAEGMHELRVRARDEAGNMDASYAATHTWHVDLTAPEAPVITSPGDGAVLLDGAVTFSGTAEAGSTVQVTLDGAVIGSTTASDRGRWSLTPPSELVEGQHAVTARASDIAGSSKPSKAVHFTIGVPGVPLPSGGCGCGAGPGDASWLLAGLAALAGGATRRRRFRA